MIPKNILDKIIIDCNNPDSIYIVGSSVLNIDNPNDVDLLLLYNKESVPIKRYAIISEDGVRYECFSNTYEKEISNVTNVCFAWTTLKLAKNIYGDDLLNSDKYKDFLYNFDLINNLKYRKDVCFKIYNEMMLVKTLKGSFDYKKNRLGTNYLYKCYRCLLICYIINNNSYELTEAQKTMLNAVHDIKEMPDKLWKFCIELIEREVGFII